MENDILYDLTPWEDAPSTATPINAENLNKQQTKIKEIIDKLHELDEAKLGKEEVPNVPVKSVNGKTGAVSLGKTDIGLGNVDNVKQYSASNPPPYPVTSVNGKTGAVTVSVPTKTSQLTNDSNFVTKDVTDQLSGQKADKTAIPTKTSQLTNDSGFLTALPSHNHDDRYFTESEANNKFQPKGDYLLSVPSEYVTETELTNKDYAIKSSLSLGKGADGKVYLFVNGSPQGNGLEIKSDVVAGDVVGFVDDNNNIIITGALADGTYVLKYEDADGVQTEIGQLAVGASLDINLLTIAITESGQPFIGTNGEIGYQTGYRISNEGEYNAKEGMYTTGYIPVEKGDTISVENMSYSFNTSNGYRCKIAFYDANFSKLSGVAPATDISGWSPFYHNATSVTGVISNGQFVNDGSITKLSQFTIEQTGVAYMRICVFQMDATSTVKKV